MIEPLQGLPHKEGVTLGTVGQEGSQPVRTGTPRERVGDDFRDNPGSEG